MCLHQNFKQETIRQSRTNGWIYLLQQCFVEIEHKLRVGQGIKATPNEAHIIFESSDPRIHPIKVSIQCIKAFTHKSLKTAKFSEDFSQKRSGIIPLWWRRWGTLVRNRQTLSLCSISLVLYAFQPCILAFITSVLWLWLSLMFTLMFCFVFGCFRLCFGYLRLV